MLRRSLCALAACAALALAAGTANADHPDLFYNYYTGPSYAGGVPAQAYVSPMPTPPYVGHTWITYQPLMPHEFMYTHHRSYYKYHPYGGWTHTKVHYW